MRIVIVAIALCTLFSCTSDNHTATSTVSPPPAAINIPAYYENVRAALPLPATLPPAMFADVKLARVYEIAQRIPAVLAQQPCYCYCDRGEGLGHRSLLDCQRDQHSAGCAICRKEVLLADRMVKNGLGAQDIRAAIVRGDWKTVTE